MRISWLIMDRASAGRRPSKCGLRPSSRKNVRLPPHIIAAVTPSTCPCRQIAYIAVAARVHGALTSVILQHAAYRETLLQQHGFTILEVSKCGGLHILVLCDAGWRGCAIASWERNS